MLLIPYFDTIYFSIKCDFDEESLIFKKINNYLSLCFKDDSFVPSDDDFEKEGLLHSCKYVVGKFYNAMYKNESLGIKVWRSPKHNVRNYPIYIELDGLFFHYFALSHLFLKFLFKDFASRLYFSRVDVRCDVIYKRLEIVDKKKDTFCVPVGFPLFSYKSKSGVNSHAPIESHAYFNETTNTFLLDTLFSGRYERKLKVYDKNLDLCNKQQESYESVYESYLIDYTGEEIEDYKDCRVFRVELMLRGRSIKNYYSNFLKEYPVSLNSLDNLFLDSLLHYIYDTFNFDNEDLNLGLSDFESVKSFSCYIKEDIKKLSEKVIDCENKIRREVNRLLAYEEDYKHMLTSGVDLIDDWSILESLTTDFDRRFLDVDFNKLKDVIGGATSVEDKKDSDMPF